MEGREDNNEIRNRIETLTGGTGVNEGQDTEDEKTEVFKGTVATSTAKNKKKR